MSGRYQGDVGPLIFQFLQPGLVTIGPDEQSWPFVDAMQLADELRGSGQAIAMLVAANAAERDKLIAVYDTRKMGPSRSGDDRYAICMVEPNAEARISRFGKAFGWSAAVSRAVHALYETCDVDHAATLLGVSVHTIREQIETARNSVGAVNVSMLFMTINIMALKPGQRGPETDLLIRYAYDLTERQFRIASRVANGSSRPEVADELGLSLALINKELGAVFSIMHVDNALALTRLFAEARMIAMGTHFGATLPAYLPPSSKTICLRAPDERRMTLSDYGPPSGRPVFVLHSSMTTRPVNAQLVEALQNAGFRPLSLDRPGFGDTDPVTSSPSGNPVPFDAAARDMIEVCRQLGFESIDIVSRGAAQVVLALHNLAPQLIARAVITNPDPDTASSSRRVGRIGAIKSNFLKRPWAIRTMARMIGALASYERVADMTRRQIVSCPPDRDVMAVDANLRAYYAGMAAMFDGHVDGYADEQAALATQNRPSAAYKTAHFTVMLGAYDFIHDPDETLAYWQQVLPDANFKIVPDAGRFLTFSHAEPVAAALKAIKIRSQ